MTGVLRAVHAGADDSVKPAFVRVYRPVKERAGFDLDVWEEHRERQMERDDRVVCGARRRRDGQPCQALSVPGKRRCKWHGGCSTGPKTAEGKARALANLRKRWPKLGGNG